jgi:hypothetical protein
MGGGPPKSPSLVTFQFFFSFHSIGFLGLEGKQFHEEPPKIPSNFIFEKKIYIKCHKSLTI